LGFGFSSTLKPEITTLILGVKPERGTLTFKSLVVFASPIFILYISSDKQAGGSWGLLTAACSVAVPTILWLYAGWKFYPRDRFQRSLIGDQERAF